MFTSKTTKALSLAIGAIVLTACSSTPPQQAYKNANVYTAQTKNAQEAKIKDNAKVLNSSPDWFLSPPVEDDAIFAATTDYSNDLQFAVDKAITSAKVKLATQLNNRVSSRTREYALEVGNGSDATLNREVERVSQVKVTAVNLSGYTVVDRVIIQQGTGFRVYLLVRYPLGESNRIATDQHSKVAAAQAAKRAAIAHAQLEEDERLAAEKEQQ